MPTYVYKCDTCKEIWEESFPYEERDRPIEDGCTATISRNAPCDGKIMRIPAMPGFAYDNISLHLFHKLIIFTRVVSH